MKKEKISYNQKSGFKTPANYFEGLEEDLLDMVKLSETLGEKKSAGFTAPIGYFDGLEDEILKKATKPETRVRNLFTKEAFLYAASIAAIVIAFASTFYINPETQTSWDNVELSVMENYIDNNNIEFSTSEISNYIFQQGYIIDDADLNTVNSDAMKNYLDENLEDPLYILDED
ncbi:MULTISPECIES: hypothetical protein [Salegentibacter]|jgi:hypothetical protein|uniref:Uncharacterized protein n=1 Tax=Salegentibacter agarivorans TaxID=345907 RepID=A0A1I2MJE1_9FLAO|nr:MULTISPECIES: hypothetical protein [Salegentibacter]APS40051.1 hypothetical protein AO058_14715 [Salegentibacter sp. T436]SFF91572.1 hypothetical protein SAMN04488033_11419 [Salegentibacter agarivorans]